jgi:hypothetical protein
MHKLPARLYERTGMRRLIVPRVQPRPAASAPRPVAHAYPTPVMAAPAPVPAVAHVHPSIQGSYAEAAAWD